MLLLNETHLETLECLIMEGPLHDGEVPSKAVRDELMHVGFVVKVCSKGTDGWNAASNIGKRAFQAHYGADTIAEAVASRRASKVITRAAKVEED